MIIICSPDWQGLSAELETTVRRLSVITGVSEEGEWRYVRGDRLEESYLSGYCWNHVSKGIFCGPITVMLSGFLTWVTTGASCPPPPRQRLTCWTWGVVPAADIIREERRKGQRQKDRERQIRSRSEDCQEDSVSGGKCEGSKRADSDGALRGLMDYRASVSGLLWIDGGIWEWEEGRKKEKARQIVCLLPIRGAWVSAEMVYLNWWLLGLFSSVPMPLQ